jgi:regulatory Fis family protein
MLVSCCAGDIRRWPRAGPTDSADVAYSVGECAGGNLSAAARLLGLTRAQLAYRLKTSAGAVLRDRVLSSR